MINIVPSGERDEKLRVLVSLLFFVDDLQNLLGFLMFESIGEVKKMKLLPMYIVHTILLNNICRCLIKFRINMHFVMANSDIVSTNAIQ